MDSPSMDESVNNLVKKLNNYGRIKVRSKYLNKMLLDLKKASIINEDLYRMLYSSDGLSPRFYGLPKIRKTGIPLRPINCPIHQFSDL